MAYMVSTLDVSHNDKSLLKDEASPNMDHILVTLDVFHNDKSLLNEEAL